MEVENNMENDYISLERNDANNLNIWNNNRDKRLIFFKFLFLFTIIISLLIFIRTPFETRIEMKKDIIERNMSKRNITEDKINRKNTEIMKYNNDDNFKNINSTRNINKGDDKRRDNDERDGKRRDDNDERDGRRRDDDERDGRRRDDNERDGKRRDDDDERDGNDERYGKKRDDKRNNKRDNKKNDERSIKRNNKIDLIRNRKEYIKNDFENLNFSENVEDNNRIKNSNNINISDDIEKLRIDVRDSIFGSHYTPQGLNKRALDLNICNDEDYTKKVLKLVYELSYFALPKNTMNIRKFEASDVKVFNEEMWVVCDNSWVIGKFGLSLTPFSHTNKLLNMRTTTSGGNPLDINKLLLGTDPDKEDSQWEAIVKDDISGNIFVIRESIPHEILSIDNNENIELSKKVRTSKHYHSHIIELAVVNVNRNESYEVLETCTAEHKFSFDNKGFEGAIGLRTRSGEFYLLGLCEGNYCMGETKGEEYGNGRLILMKKEYINQDPIYMDENNKEEFRNFQSRCIWRSIRMINIPNEVNFQDYSSIDVRGNKVAITSQEDSSMWLGEINYGDGEFLDPQKLELLPNGRILYFPRDHLCDFKYCNIEGVSFISDNMIVTVSDKMKKKNRQSPKCLDKDQSIHIFAIP